MTRLLRVVALAVAYLLLAVAAHAVPFVVSYQDAVGQGFRDPSLGEIRRSAFEFAVARWENALAGSVPITVSASMVSLGGDGVGALLAQAGTTTAHRDFGGSRPDTWFGAALANQLAGADLNGSDNPEIRITFNADIDDPDVLGSISWYYGTDAQPGSDIDLVSVVLHELGHGLGFFELVDPVSGGWKTPDMQPGIFDRMLTRPRVGDFADMRDAERLAAIISPLFWQGSAVIAFNGVASAVFTPDPFRPGTSLAHWDPESAPNELMGPSNEGAVHDFGLLLPALVDIGWELSMSSPTPRASVPPATPTATATATVPPTAAQTPPKRRDVTYVTNFDDNVVAVVEGGRVRTTIPVGRGPTGVAATRDGRLVYVTNFHDGSLSMISTRRDRVVATIPLGGSANAVAVNDDGSLLIVTDTFLDETVIVDALRRQVLSRIRAGQAPAGVALSPDDRLAFIADYGEPSVTVIDLAARLRRAIIPALEANLLGVAVARGTGIGYAVGGGGVAGTAVRFDAHTLEFADARGSLPQQPEAVAIQPDGSEAYVSGSSADGANNEVVIINVAESRVVDSVPTGILPESMALSTDGHTLFIANFGSASLSIINVQFRSGRSIPVGNAPLGVAVASVPMICDGDCDGNRAVTADEVVRSVTIAIGELPLAECNAADHDDDGEVVVDELLRAIQALLAGCAATV